MHIFLVKVLELLKRRGIRESPVQGFCFLKPLLLQSTCRFFRFLVHFFLLPKNGTFGGFIWNFTTFKSEQFTIISVKRIQYHSCLHLNYFWTMVVWRTVSGLYHQQWICTVHISTSQISRNPNFIKLAKSVLKDRRYVLIYWKMLENWRNVK